MNKIYLKLLLLLTPFTTVVNAQISAYTFASSSGTFTPITGGTAVATTVSAADFLGDTRTSRALPIGFAFKFNGTDYTSVKAMSDGFLSFNFAATTIEGNNLANAAVTSRPLVAPLWDDLDGASGFGAANYITTGSAGTRIFTIEWLNWQWNYNASGATISFQVKLYEGSNKIEFVYRQQSGAVNTGTLGASIGIAGVSTGAGNFLSLNNSGFSPTASSTTETATIVTKPATGQVYTFTPPVPCNGTPAGGTAISNLPDVCTGSQFRLSVNDGATGLSGFTYTWQSSTNNINFTDIPTATGLTYTATQTAPTYYRRNTICSGNIGSSTSVLVGVSGAASIPYIENFDNVTAPAIANCITVENVNNDNRTWVTEATTFTGSSAPNVMQYPFSATAGANDWFFTRGINLTAGVNYAITFKYAASSIDFAERLEVKAGTAPTAANMAGNNQLFVDEEITTVNDGVGIFTPTTTGVYYFGFHAYSIADRFNLMVDNIKVDAAPFCTTNLTPVNNTTIQSSTVFLGWNVVPNATSYDVMLSANGGLTYTLSTNVSAAPAILTGLAASTTYFWYVIPKNVAGAATGCQTSAFSFTTGSAPSCTVNITPVNGATTVAYQPTLTWASTPRATSYDLYLGTNANPPLLGNYIDTFRMVSTSPGTVYYWYVVPKNGIGSPTNCISNRTSFTTSPPPPIPANDDCSAAITLTASGAATCGPVVSGTLLMANASTGFPAPSCSPNGINDDVWYKFTATAASHVISVTNTAAPIGAALYTGASCNSLTQITGACAVGGTTVTGLTAGTVYYVRVFITTITAATTFNFSICVGVPPPPPANNECAGAIAISAYTGSVIGTTVNATQSMAAETCNTFTENANDDVWYKFTTVQAGTATFGVTGSSTFDPVVAGYSGTCGSLVKEACTDATGAGGIETLTLTGLLAGTTYYIRIYGAGAAGTEGTFTITATGVALPIQFAGFVGEKRGTANALSWITQSEQNNAGFELQRSADGSNFNTLTFVASKALNGNSTSSLTYSFDDVKPFAGNSYYRLKQLDKDGRFTFSTTVLIKRSKATKVELTNLYPNPTTTAVSFIIASPVSDKVNIVLTDVTGKVVMQQARQVLSGDNNFTLNVSGLSKGNYLIKIVCNNGCESAVSKFVKQ